MALPTTRTELKTYIKRRLGEPVITVNVADDQLEERIDDALAFFQDYHFGASEKVYLKHQISHSNVVFTTNTTGTFSNNELVIGQTSNTAAKVFVQSSNTSVMFTYVRVNQDQTFEAGETLVGQTSNASGVIQTINTGDWDNQYVPISDLVLNIYRVLTIDGYAVDRGTGLFSWNYQFLMNDLSLLSSSSVISYFLTRSHMEMLNDMFIGDMQLRFNRYVNKLYLDIDWQQRVKAGDFVFVEAQRILDPNDYTGIWSDRFLRDYATALVKKQWGQNLVKYEGVQMPGGVTLNGRAIYEEGNRETQALEEAIQSRFELPPEFLVM
jgi:hypothetical protein